MLFARRAPRARALFAVAVATLALSGCALTITPPRPAPVHTEEDDDLGTVEVYDVDAAGVLSPAPGDDAARVWDMFEQVVTPAFAGETMLAYRVGTSAESDTLAYVYRDDDDPALWTLAANLAYADDRDLLLSTLVHEYAHVLSLDVDDVAPTGGACETLELDEGCASESSSIYAFQRDFWDAYGADAPKPTATDPDDAFFGAHEEDFVSSYASTNVVEDYAETFMTFVLEDRPDPEASPVAAKLDFFWGYPDDVAIRERIRAEFGL